MLLLRNCTVQPYRNVHIPVIVSTPKTYTKPEQSLFAVSGDNFDAVVILAFRAT